MSGLGGSRTQSVFLPRSQSERSRCDTRAAESGVAIIASSPQKQDLIQFLVKHAHAYTHTHTHGNDKRTPENRLVQTWHRTGHHEEHWNTKPNLG